MIAVRAVRIYVAVEPANMKRSFDGLMAQVRWCWPTTRSVGTSSPSSTAGVTKLNFWCGRAADSRSFTSGSRLERSRSSSDCAARQTHVELGAHELSMLLEAST